MARVGSGLSAEFLVVSKGVLAWQSDVSASQSEHMTAWGEATLITENERVISYPIGNSCNHDSAM